MRSTERFGGAAQADVLSLLEGHVRAGFGVALLCLAVIGAASYGSLVKLNRSALWVAHSHEVIGTAHGVLTSLTDAESEGRAFVITGNPNYFDLSQRAADEARGQLQALGRLVSDNPTQEQRVQKLRPEVEAHLSNIAAVEALRQRQGEATAAAAIEEDHGHRAARSSIEAFLAAEGSLLVGRQTVAATSGSTARALILGGGVLASGIAVLALLTLHRSIGSRRASERVMTEALGALKSDVVDRTERLEHSARELEQEVLARRATQRDLEAQIERLNLLHQITGAIGERQDLHSIFSVVTSTLQAHLPLEFCCVALRDDSGPHLRVAAAGADRMALSHSLDLNYGALLEIAAEDFRECLAGRLIYEPDLRDLTTSFSRQLVANGIHALTMAPLQVEDEVFGVLLGMRSAPRSFSSSECEFLHQLSEHVALAAYQARLYRRLAQAYDDLHKTQVAMLDQERLRALGQLASGIAHDINNRISPVTLYLEALLETETQISADGKEHLEIIQRAIGDVSQTASRLREFSRKGEAVPKMAPVSLNALVQQSVELTRARWSDLAQQRGVVVSIRTDLAEHLPPILGVQSELRDALINLIFNAVDALPNGGIVTVRTRIMSAAGETAEAAPGCLALEVIDDGIGMDEATRRRCLEPFFTTKGAAGTGLGLAMVYGTVQRHQARLDIESEAGYGTTVRLRFRADSLAPDGSVAARRASVPSLHILAIDDDPLIAGAVRLRLQSAGHRVATAEGGQAGIDAFLRARAGDPFQVVFTDLGMPGVDGHQVAYAVKAASPDTPVVLLTGWGQRLRAEESLPANIDCILSKPPTLESIHCALAELFAGRPPGAP